LAKDNTMAPLHFAAKPGNVNLVKFLMENGAGPNAVNKTKSTPHHLAAENGHKEVAQHFLDGVPDVRLADKLFRTLF
jgi:ankyrin repeat protein